MNSSDLETYDSIFINWNDTLQVCFNRTASHGSALWIENSVEKTLPSFVLQFAIILALNRFLLLVSAQYHVPRIVANIFTGFLLGPSVLGRWNAFIKNTFPFSNMVPLETVGAVILVYYVFMLGLEIDFKPITRLHHKAALVAIAGTIFTSPIGCGLYFMLVTDMGRKSLSHVNVKGATLWGITLSCSSEFPEIAKILSDLKLLLTENGQLALTACLINDLFSWTLLVLALTHFYYASLTSLVITVVLVLVCFFALHPFFKWLFNNVGMRDREFLESQVIFVLHIVLVFGFLADGLGVLSITGAFFLGVVIPQGALNNAVQDKVQDFVAVFMMPLFFVAVGERIKVQDFALDTHGSTVVVVVVLAFVAKIVCTMAVSWFFQMPHMEGLSLALLMNTKGTMPLIILCTGRDRLELDNQTFGVMLLACWLMTIPVGPVSVALTKASKTGKFQGSVQGATPDSPLKVLACIHTKRDANVIINLLKASCPSVRTPIQVLAVELNKMTNRPASSLIIRDARKPSFTSKSLRLDTEDTLGSFDNLSQAIFGEKMRIISDYNSMHKDILNLARQRGVTLILTTLYKQPTYDGLGAGAATARAVNIINRDRASKDEKKVVLEGLVRDAACCVAIFVDRGLSHNRSKEQRVAMFYIAGADDREALCYAWRMSGSPEVKLTVVRLVWENPNDEFDETDKEFIKGFVQQSGDVPRVRYLEKAVRDEKETVKLLNKVGSKGFDLYVVGRGHGRKMSLAQTVDPVLEEPALGPLGDALTDLNSAAETSILIFQRQAQHVEEGKHAGSASASQKGFDSMVDQQLLYPPTRSPPMLFGHYA
ncbi:Cation/H(+) antiporter 15 [Spatholobus suberectus]|nr:Cation/H(+) antiporter 15 [Spatholobus suberectus]